MCVKNDQCPFVPCDSSRGSMFRFSVLLLFLDSIRTPKHILTYFREILPLSPTTRKYIFSKFARSAQIGILHTFFQMRFSRIVVGFRCSLKIGSVANKRATFQQWNAKKIAFDLPYFLTIKGYANFFNTIIGDVQLSAPDNEQRSGTYTLMCRDSVKKFQRKNLGQFLGILIKKLLKIKKIRIMFCWVLLQIFLANRF